MHECYNFDIVPYQCGNIVKNKDLEHSIEKIKKDCQELNYPIDGIVVKYNNCNEYEAAGRTDHHYKGGFALKFYDEEYETILRDIEWTMGRTRSSYSCCYL